MQTKPRTKPVVSIQNFVPITRPHRYSKEENETFVEKYIVRKSFSVQILLETAKTHSLAPRLVEKALAVSGRHIYFCAFPGCRSKTLFVRRSPVRRHILGHLPCKNTLCPHFGCDKSFPDKSTLKRHILSHKKAKPYICPSFTCKMEFTRGSTLKNHLLYSHRICPEDSLIKAVTCVRGDFGPEKELLFLNAGLKLRITGSVNSE